MPKSKYNDEGNWSEWDNWCYLRANNPTHGKWRLAVVALLTLVGVIAAGVRVWMMMQ